jgi:hypothetical protein
MHADPKAFRSRVSDMALRLLDKRGMARIVLKERAVQAGDFTVNSCGGVLLLVALLPLAVAAVAGMLVALSFNMAWGVTTCAWGAGRRRIARLPVAGPLPASSAPVKEAAGALSLVKGYENLPALSRAA